MKRSIARLLAATAIAIPVAVPAAAPAAPVAPLHQTAVTHSCGNGYTHGVIGGAHKCLRRGQFCARRYQRQYVRYGFSCSSRTAYGWRLT